MTDPLTPDTPAQEAVGGLSIKGFARRVEAEFDALNYPESHPLRRAAIAIITGEDCAARIEAELAEAAEKGRQLGLREAAQAVVDQWDTPNWKLTEATGHIINRLRRALAGEGE